MKKSPDGINGRLEMTENKISEFKDRDRIYPMLITEKKQSENKKSLEDLWEYNERGNSNIISIREWNKNIQRTNG